jgi:hypothetical protein
MSKSLERRVKNLEKQALADTKLDFAQDISREITFLLEGCDLAEALMGLTLAMKRLMNDFNPRKRDGILNDIKEMILEK